MTGARAEQPALALTEAGDCCAGYAEPTAWILLEELALRSVHVDG